MPGARIATPHAPSSVPLAAGGRSLLAAIEAQMARPSTAAVLAVAQRRSVHLTGVSTLAPGDLRQLSGTSCDSASDSTTVQRAGGTHNRGLMGTGLQGGLGEVLNFLSVMPSFFVGASSGVSGGFGVTGNAFLIFAAIYQLWTASDGADRAAGWLNLGAAVLGISAASMTIAEIQSIFPALTSALSASWWAGGELVANTGTNSSWFKWPALAKGLGALVATIAALGVTAAGGDAAVLGAIISVIPALGSLAAAAAHGVDWRAAGGTLSNLPVVGPLFDALWNTDAAASSALIPGGFARPTDYGSTSLSYV